MKLGSGGNNIMNPKYKIGEEIGTGGYGLVKIIDILKSETRFCYLIKVDGSDYLIFEEEIE